MAKILIVDDNEDFCETMRDILSDVGYEVFNANNGSDALEKLSTLTPDLMMIDEMLPDISGQEVCKRIRENDFYQEFPILVMTGKVGGEERLRGEVSGRKEVITKPFDFKELLEKIKCLLGK